MVFSATLVLKIELLLYWDAVLCVFACDSNVDCFFTANWISTRIDVPELCAICTGGLCHLQCRKVRILLSLLCEELKSRSFPISLPFELNQKI